ncbi:hypothetical protein TIFTF001_028757 [Ficus carica]|uniref:Uncharacterized protein n=1 Tax=Ficus carica TaxID=3494 RepID=A0AA88J1Z0_FICCA|nr:hypothetical protein TIFTF001_028757 [Ficus carica]
MLGLHTAQPVQAGVSRGSPMRNAGRKCMCCCFPSRGCGVRAVRTLQEVYVQLAMHAHMCAATLTLCTVVQLQPCMAQKWAI